MTTETLMPDVVKMGVSFLRAQSEVTDLMGATTSARGRLDKNTQYPAVRVVRISSEPVHSRPFVVERVRVQFDCYGGNNREAERLAQNVRSTLIERAVGFSSDGGLVTKVIPVSMDDLADESFEPVKERYIVEMDIWVKASIS